MAFLAMVAVASVSVGALGFGGGTPSNRVPGAPRQYKVEVVERSKLPLVSHANSVGHGYSPYFDTFNPSYIPPSTNFPGGLLLRLANGTGGGGESIGFAPCNITDGGVVCGDLDLSFDFGADVGAQDPRAFLYAHPPTSIHP